MYTLVYAFVKIDFVYCLQQLVEQTNFMYTHVNPVVSRGHIIPCGVYDSYLLRGITSRGSFFNLSIFSLLMNNTCITFKYLNSYMCICGTIKAIKKNMCTHFCFGEHLLRLKLFARHCTVRRCNLMLKSPSDNPPTTASLFCCSCCVLK